MNALADERYSVDEPYFVKPHTLRLKSKMSFVSSATRGNVEKQRADKLPESVDPTPEEIASLSMIERISFRIVHRMNRGRAKRFGTWCQKTVGAGWIHLATYNILRVHGLENFARTSAERPILLVANHRSFFDMYAVSTVLLRHTRSQKKLFFPVRGRFFYESLFGLFVNFIMGWWSMYPPFFATNEKRLFDKYSLRRLVQLCKDGTGNIVGFHPEGTRNRASDPYSYLPAQPGVGRLIKEAAPQVVPVFIAGLDNNLVRQIARNWTKSELIRVHFGAPLDLTSFLAKRGGLRTYKEIADEVMKQIAQLGEHDRAMYGSKPNTEPYRIA